MGEIVRGTRGVTTDTALRLAKALGVDERFWINVRIDDDLDIEQDRHGDELAAIVTLVAS